MLLLLSFLSWVLTIIAPCVLPLLPVILSGSFWDIKSKSTPYIIIGALTVSLFFFSILLKVSTLFIWVPEYIWRDISSIIIVFLGVTFTFPSLWQTISLQSWLEKESQKILNEASHRNWHLRNILIGFSLWPIFSSCSPTYLIILSIILPVNIFQWVAYLLSYILWLVSVLLVIVLLGQKFIKKVKWISNPNWAFKKILWLILILVWISIITWLDKEIEAKILTIWTCQISSFEDAFVAWYKK